MTDVKRLLDEATPPPWYALGQRIVRGKEGVAYCESDGGDPINGYLTDEQKEDEELRNAALIVYAVNHLPAFLALYEEAATVVSSDEAFNADGSSRMPALAAAVDALAELDG